jgi:Flp pilus assembly secretin CpaC
MRRASYQLVAGIAAVVVTGAAAIAAAPNGKVTLRASAAPAAAPASSTAPAAMLRTNNGKVAAVKAPKPAPHKFAVVRVKASHRHVAWHRAAAPSISVPLDEVRVVAFSQPISTVYVGNPMIADVSMIDSRHAFVLGKGFGATNIVALDADGKQVVNDAVTVFGHTGSTVILHRGTAQATYACTGARCETAPTPGDDKDSFSSRMEQMAAHQDAGVKAAAAGR